MIVRPAVESDHPQIQSILSHDPLNWVDPRTYAKYLGSGSYTAERMWLAEEDGRVRACAVWYGSDDHIPILDCLWVDREVDDRARLGATLLPATALPFEYHLFLKPRWREDAVACAEVAWRCAAAETAGLTSHLERLRYEWTAESGLPLPSERLIFLPESDAIVRRVRRRAARATPAARQRRS